MRSNAYFPRQSVLSETSVALLCLSPMKDVLYLGSWSRIDNDLFVEKMEERSLEQLEGKLWDEDLLVDCWFLKDWKNGSYTNIERWRVADWRTMWTAKLLQRPQFSLLEQTLAKDVDPQEQTLSLRRKGTLHDCRKSSQSTSSVKRDRGK